MIETRRSHTFLNSACMFLTFFLAEEKAKEAESKARALELKLGDDLSKDARVRSHNFLIVHSKRISNGFV